MKKLIALLLSVLLCFTLCACGNKSLNIDDMVKITLQEGIDFYSEQGLKIESCLNVKSYAFEGNTLISANLYYLNETGATRYHNMYCIFTEKELIEKVIYENDRERYNSIFDTIKSLEPTELTVNAETISALNIKEFNEWGKAIATEIACDYLINYMKNLKNPYSIQVYSVDCVVDMIYSNVKFSVNLSAENQLGGTVTKQIGCMDKINFWEKDYITSSIASTLYYNEKYGDTVKNDPNSISLDAESIQTYILENF